ncbi:MAG: heme exporter protein CcmD [Hyphomicrobiales bacterium]|nr:MAG: heme exporter protein CcmD [Hyphomicrobiales bacterium]
MGKYAFFIWTSYGISAAVLIGLTVYLWADLRKQARILARLEKEGAPRRPKAMGPADDPVREGAG